MGAVIMLVAIQDMSSCSYLVFCILLIVTLCEANQPQYIVYQPTLNSGRFKDSSSGHHQDYFGQYPVYNQLLTRDPHPTILIKPQVPNQRPVVVTLPALEVAKGVYHVDLSSALTNLRQGRPNSKELPRTDGKRICLPANSPILLHLTIQPESVQKTADRINVYCYRVGDLKAANIIE